MVRVRVGVRLRVRVRVRVRVTVGVRVRVRLVGEAWLGAAARRGLRAWPTAMLGKRQGYG